MSFIVDKVVRFNQFLFHDLADDRSRHFPLVENPWPLLSLLVFYNVFVLKLGPYLMRNRQPFNVKYFMLAFDAVQIVANFICFYKGIEMGWLWRFSPFCYEIDYSDAPYVKEIIYYCWFYYMLKISDLIDTVFFVLRKKFSHISFLHVYHHTGMTLLAGSNIKYFPGGHHTFLGVINAFVHCVMYTYYLVTNIYPQKRLLSVKKLVTQIQMYQFLIAFIHMSMVLFTPNCVYPKWTLFILLPNNLMIFVLFYDFYKKTYLNKKDK